MTKYPAVKAFFDEHVAGDRSDRSRLRRALEESTGVSNATISRWINGDSRPDRDHWQAISDVLGVPPEQLQAAVDGQGTVSLIDRVAGYFTGLGLLMELSEGSIAVVGRFDRSADTRTVADALWAYWADHPHEGPTTISAATVSQPTDVRLEELGRAVARLSKTVDQLQDAVAEQRKTIASLRSSQLSK